MIEEEKSEETAEETAPAEEPAAEAPAETGEPAAEAPAKPPAEAPAEPAEPEEELGPKERRRRARSRHSGNVRPQRSAEERAEARAEGRRKKAAERQRWRKRDRERRRARPKTEPLAKAEHGPGRPRVRQGIVVSDKADKTITVRIDVTRSHRVYKKIVRESSTLRAHDERNEAHAGDTVRVVESRPLSRTKRWRLVEVLERAR